MSLLPTVSAAPAGAASVLLATTLIGGIGLIAAHRWQRAGGGPAARAFVLRTTLASMVLALLAAFVVGAAPDRPALVFWRVPIASSPAPASIRPFAQPGRANVSAPPTARPGNDTHASETPAASPSEQKQRRWPIAGATIAAFWLAGTMLLLARLAVAHARLRRLRTASAALPDTGEMAVAARLLRDHFSAAGHNAGPPLLLASPAVRTPFLAGMRRPALFLPASWASDYDAATLAVIARHEAAHLRRHDCLWTALSQIVCALLWPQPLAWLASARLAQASEEACDAEAVAATSANYRATYADCLLRLAERAGPRAAPPLLGAGVVPTRSSLGRRVEQILKGPETMKSVSPVFRLATAIAGLLLATTGVFLVSFSAPAASRAQQSGTTAPDPSQPVLITLNEKEVLLPELLAKMFEQAKPAGVTYRVAVDLAPIRTPITLDWREGSLDGALLCTLNMVQPPLTYARSGNVYVISAAPSYSLKALNRADVRQALDHLFTQAGVRFALDDDVRGVITLPPAKQTLISALNEITGNAVPRLRWSKKSDTYVVSLAPKQPLPAILPRVSVDASEMRVGKVLEQAFKQANVLYRIHLDTEQNEPITVHLRNMPLDKALTYICAQASPALTWSWNEYAGTFIITSTRMTISAVSEPVANVLLRIVGQAGCAFNGSGFDPAVSNKRITVDFRNEPLDRALDRVCAQASPQLTWVWNGPGTTITVRPRE